MNKRWFLGIMALAMVLTMLCGCGAQPAAQTPAAEPEPAEEPAEPVTLRVVGPWEDFPALEAVAEGFTQRYENCSIEYEYMQDYYAALETRLQTGEDAIDLFITVNLQADSALLPYALDLYADDTVDLSETFEGLLHNFELRGEHQLYAVPMGAELRGMYVNVTLLDSLGLSVPSDRAELLDCCAVLAENGFVALQGNPGAFAQQLMYPYCCNLVANADDYDAAYALVNDRSDGAAELFREPMALMYELAEKGYYNYKYVETEYGTFTDTSNEGYSRYFLNVLQEGEEFVKQDDVGTVAFMPAPGSMSATLEKMKSDYHSDIEYEFILSPVSEDGGFAYLSPAHGIAVNKNSGQLAWAVKLLNYLFEPEVNEKLAEKHGIMPNSADVMEIITRRFSIPADHIAELGQVTFDFDFYKAMTASLVEVCKANNPKYMVENADGSTQMYDLEHFMENLALRLNGSLTE